MKSIKLALLSFACLFGSAQAAELSFNNLKVGYGQFDFDCTRNCDGFNLAGGLEFNENFFGKLDYNGFSGDVGLTFVDVGYRWNLSDTAAFFATVGFARIDSNLGDESDASLGFGLRGMVAPSFELEGNLRSVSPSQRGEGIAEVSGTYFLTESAGVNVTLRGLDGAFGGIIGARFNF